MPPCSGCGVDRAKSDFTNSQLKLKAARRCKACVAGAPATAQPRSIAGAFMTAAELPSSLVDASRLRLARVYMDHDFPVKMSDGSPKQIPAAALQCADASELMRTFGYGAGGFMGEVLFWKRHHGVLLGKQKWECHSDEGPEGDTAAMSELWEARWLFASSAEARRFHADMLSASRGERGCGYLDGPEPGLEDTRGACRERPDVFSGALCEAGGAVEGLVVSSNEPRPLPKRGGLRSPEVGRAPTQYLQQHSAAFVVDRVVAKLFVASGINARDAAGRHVGVTPAAFVQLVRVASEAISRWLAHGRTPGTAVSFDAFFEQLLRSGTISEAQFDRITDELANGCKTEAALVAEWAAATGSGPPGGPDGEQRPKARSHGSLAAEVMGEGVALRPGGKVRIVGLQGRRDLNGLFGEVVSLGDDPHSERLTIKVKGVSTGSGQINVVSGEYPYQCVRIKPANLVPVYDTPQHETQGLCPICMSVEMRTILDGAQNATMMTCCGKPICLKCLYEIETGPVSRRHRPAATAPPARRRARLACVAVCSERAADRDGLTVASVARAMCSCATCARSAARTRPTRATRPPSAA